MNDSLNRAAKCEEMHLKPVSLPMLGPLSPEQRKLKKAVEAGMGGGCLSRMAVQRELNNWWLMEIGTPLDLRRTLYIVTRGNSYQTRLFRAYADLLESISG